MTDIQELIDKLHTEEGKQHAREKIKGNSTVNNKTLPVVIAQAQGHLEKARAFENENNTEKAQSSYKQAMHCYEKAGIFSFASSVAELIGDQELKSTYHQIQFYNKKS